MLSITFCEGVGALPDFLIGVRSAIHQPEHTVNRGKSAHIERLREDTVRPQRRCKFPQRLMLGFMFMCQTVTRQSFRQRKCTKENIEKHQGGVMRAAEQTP